MPSYQPSGRNKLGRAFFVASGAAVTRQIGEAALQEDLHAKVLLIHDDCED